MPIEAGISAPNFILSDESGKSHQLSDYHGQIVVLYFYPKDDTPGCTKEACGFRDDFSAYEESGAIIVGVSPDNEKSHAKFKNKFNLPFALLADPDHQVCELYQVWGRKKFMGKEYDGVFRTTFLIGRDGVISRVFTNVKPDAHSKDILDAIAQLSP